MFFLHSKTLKTVCFFISKNSKNNKVVFLHEKRPKNGCFQNENNKKRRLCVGGGSLQHRVTSTVVCFLKPRHRCLGKHQQLKGGVVVLPQTYYDAHGTTTTPPFRSCGCINKSRDSPIGQDPSFAIFTLFFIKIVI